MDVCFSNWAWVCEGFIGGLRLFEQDNKNLTFS